MSIRKVGDEELAPWFTPKQMADFRAVVPAELVSVMMDLVKVGENRDDKGRLILSQREYDELHRDMAVAIRAVAARFRD